jgi:hypothetical protein
MGKLKEKLLNNLSEEQMEDIFGISSFEYVELMTKYKDDENYPITEAEVEDIERMVEDYYASKEFADYLETIDIDKALAEHNAHEEGFDIEALNDSMTLKYTDNDILDVLDGMVDPQKIDIIMGKLNDIWNNKNGVF